MRALRTTLYLLAATLLGVLALAGALWLWSGSGTSLATSLGQLARYLPAGQTLEAKDVTGSLRGGGSIGWLRWQQGELSVELHDVTIAWSLRPLLGGELRLGKVAARPRSPPPAHRLPTCACRCEWTCRLPWTAWNGWARAAHRGKPPGWRDTIFLIATRTDWTGGRCIFRSEEHTSELQSRF